MLLLAALVGSSPWWPAVAAKAGSLATPTGQVAQVRIPAVGVEAKVVEVALEETGSGPAWEVADYAVGHHAGSGTPGQERTVVLAGHNNTRGEVFRRLHELVEGDLVEVRTADGGWHSYAVTGSRIVLEEGAPLAQRRDNAALLADTGEERLVLVTCWPYQPDPPYRLVVEARPHNG